jgi:hypothetical protein
MEKLPDNCHEQTIQAKSNEASYIGTVINPPCSKHIPDKHAPEEVPEYFSVSMLNIALRIIMIQIQQGNQRYKYKRGDAPFRPTEPQKNSTQR